MFELTIPKMARKGGNKIFTSPCFSKIFLLYISLLLSIPCLSFIYSLWFLLITIPILLLSTLLHITLFHKKPASPGFLETTVQEGLHKFHLQEKLTDQETKTEPETNHETVTEPEMDDSSDNDEDDDGDEEEEEEGLIEIALAGEAKEQKLHNLQKCFSGSSLIRQEDKEMIMEIWAEVEEENFIEIDISMGSITSLEV